MRQENTPQSESITLASNREGLPDLRLLHYNDVYHVEYDIYLSRMEIDSVLTVIISDPDLRSPLGELLAFRLWSTSTDPILDTKGRLPSLPSSLATPSTPVLKVRLPREGTWYPS